MKRELTKTELWWIDKNTTSYKGLIFSFIIWLAVSFLVYLGCVRAEARMNEFLSRPDAGQILFLNPTYEIPGDQYWIIVAFYCIGSLIYFIALVDQLFHRFYISYLRRKRKNFLTRSTKK